MISIRCASKHDDLQSLWRACFPDDGSEFYFPEEYDPSRALVAAEGDSPPVGALHYTLHTLALEGQELTAAYTLGIGVLPDWQGQGLGGALVRRLLEELRRQEIPLCFLLPGGKGLAGYYAHLGFLQPGLMPRLSPEIPALPEAGPEDFPVLNALYEAQCASVLHPRRSLEAWARIAREYRLCLGAGRYLAYDGDRLLEDSAAPLAPHPMGACVRILDEAVISREAIGKCGFYANLLHN